MSSASAGKFQDHYEVLGVEHKAVSAAIQAAYARLSEKHHPMTGALPDKTKYEAITLAFEVLSDPELRAEFNKLRGIGGEEKPKFGGLPFFEGYVRDINLRVVLLCVLYDRRRSKPFTPSLSMRHLEGIIAATSEELNFALWYLKIRDMVTMDDKSSMQITPDGMDYLQTHPPSPEAVMQLIRGSEGDNAEENSAVEDTSASVEALANVTGDSLAPAPVLPTPETEGGESIRSSATRIGNILARRKS